MAIIIVYSNIVGLYYPISKYIISNNNLIYFLKKIYWLKSNNSDFKYSNKISFSSMAAPSSKHREDPKAKIELRSKLKYNLEDKMSIE